jgi:hypothetical protein
LVVVQIAMLEVETVQASSRKLISLRAIDWSGNYTGLGYLTGATKVCLQSVEQMLRQIDPA